MKKLYFLLLFFSVGAFSLQAQIKTPAASPAGSFKQMVGLTEVEVEYNRPSAKGRQIFGADGLVQYGKMWRTGANASSKISFSDDVKIEGKSLKAGKYALYTVPGADSWDVIFYSSFGNWGLPQTYNEADEALRVKVKPIMLNSNVETFTIQLGNLSNDGATLEISWEKTLVPVKIQVDVDDKVVANIQKVLNGPSAGDYYTAGSYYHDAGKDLNQALAWVQKANEMDAKFWTTRREAMILADLGRFADAIAVAEKSKEAAMAAGNDDYVRMNEKSIAEWKKKVPMKMDNPRRG
jgi:hypothetical protein